MSGHRNRIDTNLILGRPGTHPWGADSADELLKSMDRHGVERGLVSHIASSLHDARIGNELLFSSLTSSKDSRLHPVPVVRIRNLPDDDVWVEWRSQGVRCVRVCPAFYKEQTVPSAQRRMLRQALKRHDCFLQVSHVPFYGSSLTSATVADAARLADAIAPIPLMLAGIARRNYTEVEELLASQENVLVDVGNLTTGTAVQTLVASGFEDMLVWGSGFGVSYAMQFADVISASGIPDAAIDKILYTNAKALMRA